MADFLEDKPEKGSFSSIKHNLDPRASYIVFENDLEKQGVSGGASIFDPAQIGYAYLSRENYVWQQVIDMDHSREYLVIRIRSGDEDQILARVMGCGFSDNIICYIFKAKEDLQ